MSERLTAALARWVAFAQRHAREVVWVDAGITIVCGLAAFLFLGINMDNKAVIDDHLPFVGYTAELEEYFPSL